jgi:N-acetylglucosaminyldiphosphoundecaprenol N-acetyl-beta-D-mannosaminyltransferase
MMPPRLKNQIFGIRLSTLGKDELLNRLLVRPHAGMGVRLVATANLDHVVTLRKDCAFRASYNHAWMVTADGAPIFVYARLLGIPLPERVTGFDLIDGLLERLSPEHHRLFFVTCRPRAGSLIAAEFIAKGFRPDQIAWAVPARGFERRSSECRVLAEMVRQHNPTHLIIGIGALQGQTWLNRCDENLGDLFALCIGAAIEFRVGLKRRAPQEFRRAGFEWLWRMLMEPRRLARRYLVESWSFIPAVASDLVTHGEQCRFSRSVQPPKRQLSPVRPTH